MSTYTRILMDGDWKHPLSKAVKTALESAVKSPRLPFHINLIEGMSGLAYREFINYLVSIVDNPRYLEIGSWAGSTACSAMYNNKLTINCVDNWSEFGGPKEQFFNNIKNNTTESTVFNFYESDFRQLDYKTVGKHNIYLFDGPHEYEDQKDGVCIPVEALDDTYILIVDDYNWPKVRNGTLDGLSKLNYTILSSIEVRTTEDDSHPAISGRYSNWHNGYFIAVVSKNN
jgi:hypothetical protein